MPVVDTAIGAGASGSISIRLTETLLTSSGSDLPKARRSRVRWHEVSNPPLVWPPRGNREKGAHGAYAHASQSAPELPLQTASKSPVVLCGLTRGGVLLWKWENREPTFIAKLARLFVGTEQQADPSLYGPR